MAVRETIGLAGRSFRQVDCLAAGDPVGWRTRVAKLSLGAIRPGPRDSQGARKSGV